MSMSAFIEINESRINYEIRENGESIVGVPPFTSEDDIGDAIIELRSKYDFVDIDSNGDLIVRNRQSENHQ
ncbi:hypothetical protein [Thiolapillus sp.]|uniref:hypothetical protein n=1 Tax=Thiolapillus sp. TaxID=2017437 RepID=UPI0025F544FC|nr:hypothetical protein [Thiolapillus sp.]